MFDFTAAGDKLVKLQKRGPGKGLCNDPGVSKWTTCSETLFNYYTTRSKLSLHHFKWIPNTRYSIQWYLKPSQLYATNTLWPPVSGYSPTSPTRLLLDLMAGHQLGAVTPSIESFWPMIEKPIIRLWPQRGCVVAERMGRGWGAGYST